MAAERCSNNMWLLGRQQESVVAESAGVAVGGAIITRGCWGCRGKIGCWNARAMVFDTVGSVVLVC